MSIEELQNQGFGSHGGRMHTVHGDIQPLGKRVLVEKMHFGETKTKGGIILTDVDGTEQGIHPRWSRAIKVGEGDTAKEVRMIDEDDILLVSDEEPDQNRLKAGYVNTGGHKQMTKLPGND